MTVTMKSAQQWAGGRLASASGLSAPLLVVAILALMVLPIPPWLLDVFFGVCVLCGVGFTMSLFIGSLAFEGAHAMYEAQVKLGVLLGSLLSAVLATALLLRSRPRD